MVDWGAVEAISTTVAALGTVVVLGNQVRDRRREAEDRRRAQASKFRLLKVTSNGYVFPGGTPYTVARCGLTNLSDEPISSMELTIAAVVESAGTVLADTRETVKYDRFDPGVGELASVQVDVPGLISEMPVVFRGSASVSFTDAAGLRWRRDAASKLHQVRFD